MSISGLNADELTHLRAYLLAALDHPCIPEWEFEPLIGCSPAEARRRIESDLERAGHDEQLLDQVVSMLSMLAGASQPGSQALRLGPEGAPRAQLDQLIERLSRLGDEHRAVRQSSVCRRPRAQPLDLPHAQAMSLRAERKR